MSSTQPKTLRVGTRASILAVWQAEKVVTCLQELQQQCAIVKVQTSGDMHQQGSLADIGGKGLFSKEIDRALIAGEIDFAVHSLKDLETTMPTGIVIAAVLPRDDARDAFLGQPLHMLPSAAKVGTCSVRRAAQVLKQRPDVRIIPMRGSVQTRLQKLKSGAADATLLSYAGLLRLGLEAEAAEVFAVDDMIPAVGQGVIAVCARSEDSALCAMLSALNDVETDLAITAERAMLAVLDGSCHTPIGGYAVVRGGMLILSAMLLSLDGTKHDQYQDSIDIDVDDPHLAAQKLGQRVAGVLRDRSGAILAETCAE